MDNSIQNAITIKRLRSNDSLMLTFGNNGIPLYQAIEESSGSVAPDWEVGANQPVIIPSIESTRGSSIVVVEHKWKYNGTALIFNGVVSGGWTTDSTGRFQMNAEGHLKIVKNLASINNLSDDTLNYTGRVTSSNVDYELSGDRTIIIQKMGASSYYATILADSEILTSDKPTVSISTKLFHGLSEVSSYHVKWYKNTTAWADKLGQKNISVTRSDVGGSQLFIAEMYKSSSDSNVLARVGIKITDLSDEFKVVLEIISDNKEVYVDKDGLAQSVTVQGKIVNMSLSAVHVPTTSTWKMDVMKREDWTSLKSSNTDTIIVTTAETDRDGKIYDVDVVGEVSFN